MGGGIPNTEAQKVKYTADYTKAATSVAGATKQAAASTILTENIGAANIQKKQLLGQ